MAGSGTRLYTIWKGMKGRCQTVSSSSYRLYGGRGITVCAEWQTFVGFLDWALAHGYEDDCELDRIDSRGAYAPDNCRWVLPIVNRSRTALPQHSQYLLTLTGLLDETMIVDALVLGRRRKLADGKGLLLFVLATGKASWCFRYKVDGEERQVTFGAYPKLSLGDVRELREVARKKIAEGRDPVQEQAQIRAKRVRRKSRQ